MWWKAKKVKTVTEPMRSTDVIKDWQSVKLGLLGTWRPRSFGNAGFLKVKPDIKCKIWLSALKTTNTPASFLIALNFVRFSKVHISLWRGEKKTSRNCQTCLTAYTYDMKYSNNKDSISDGTSLLLTVETFSKQNRAEWPLLPHGPKREGAQSIWTERETLVQKEIVWANW